MRRILLSTTVPALSLVAACSGAPTDDAESEAAAYTADADNYVQNGMHVDPANTADVASSPSPDAHNTGACSRARPPRGATLNHHGGALLNHAQVYNIGYGNVSAGNTMNAFTRWLVESSYVTDLGEYGVGNATFVKGFQGARSSTRSVTDSQIQGFLGHLVNTGALPRDFTGEELFIVYTEPGVTVVNNHDHNSRSCANFCGYHGSFTMPPNFVHTPPTTVNYAVIPDTSSCLDSCWVGENDRNREKTISHELAEALTDPRLNNWFDSANGQEIGDLCNSAFYTTTNGFTAQCEWSNRHGGCVHNTPAR
jgi:hypothetical protein